MQVWRADNGEGARTEQALREREADLIRVQRIAQVGGLDVDVANGLKGWRSPEYLKLHGLNETREPETHAEWLLRVHPDDREQADRALRTALAGDASTYDNEYRIIRPSDGAIRWIHARADVVRDEDGSAVRLLGAHLDVTEQKYLHETLQRNQERNAFLLKLSDTLRALREASDIRAAGLRLLVEHLHADQACYYEIETMAVRAQHPQHGEAAANQWDIADCVRAWGSVARPMGDPVIVPDVEAQTQPAGSALALSQALDIRALIIVPLLKDGVEIIHMAVFQTTPRTWTEDEINLVREAADRTWAASEYARTEAALRESEERFRQFSAASSDALWIRDANTLHMEFASRAIEGIYQIPAQSILGDIALWADRIVPDDREAAVANIKRVCTGAAVVHEFRIHLPDGTLRWIRNNDFPLFDRDGKVVRVAGITQDITESKEADQRQKVLLAELQHRVRNILAKVRSIIQRTSESSETVEELSMHLDGRIESLARTQVILARDPGAGIDLEDILREELLAQPEVREQVSIEGPSVGLAPKAAEVLTLALHELATNAIKYGALKERNGRIEIGWRVEPQGADHWLRFSWVESGVKVLAPAPRREGFGSELITQRVPYELGGAGVFELRPGGLRATIAFPLQGGSSILEMAVGD